MIEDLEPAFPEYYGQHTNTRGGHDAWLNRDIATREGALALFRRTWAKKVPDRAFMADGDVVQQYLDEFMFDRTRHEERLLIRAATKTHKQTTVKRAKEIQSYEAYVTKTAIEGTKFPVYVNMTDDRAIVDPDFDLMGCCYG